MTYHFSQKANPVRVLRDTNLSLEAKGAYCMMRFLSQDGKYDGQFDFHKPVLDELLEKGYAVLDNDNEGGAE